MGRSLRTAGLRRSLVVVAVGAALVLASCGGTEEPSDLTADGQQEPATTPGIRTAGTDPTGTAVTGTAPAGTDPAAPDSTAGGPTSVGPTTTGRGAGGPPSGGGPSDGGPPTDDPSATGPPVVAPTTGAPIPKRSVIVFTKAAGFRHDSIGPAADVLRSRLSSAGAAVTVTDDAGVFSSAGLAGIDVVVFVSTTGDVLDDGQQAALQSWVEGGGGWVGVHAALDAEYEWPFYEMLAGAWFLQHPAVQGATVRVEDRDHPATAHLPVAWSRSDEWYDLRADPRPGAHVLATVDESTYDGGVMGADHPIAWCDTVGQGQTFVTAMGHTNLSWSDPAFVAHVLGGIESVLEPGSCG